MPVALQKISKQNFDRGWTAQLSHETTSSKIVKERFILNFIWYSWAIWIMKVMGVKVRGIQNRGITFAGLIPYVESGLEALRTHSEINKFKVSKIFLFTSDTVHRKKKKKILERPIFDGIWYRRCLKISVAFGEPFFDNRHNFYFTNEKQEKK